MKERVWINVPIKFKGELSDWHEFFSYESEDNEVGKLAVYSLYANSKVYNRLIKFLQENDINYYIFRRSYTFTIQEKENAEILWFWTDTDAQDSFNLEPTYSICTKCGKKVPLISRHKLHIDYKKIKKYDMMSTYNGDIETIVSEKVKDLFIKENVSGVEFEPIYQLGKEGKMIEGFYHLVLKEGIGDIVEPSVIEKKNLCPECNIYDEFICKMTLNFNRKAWKGYDICYTKNWFGAPSKFKDLIISNKLYKILIQNKIKNVYFQPAYFVD